MLPISLDGPHPFNAISITSPYPSTLFCYSHEHVTRNHIGLPLSLSQIINYTKTLSQCTHAIKFMFGICISCCLT